jgi:hypothetical protein
MINILSIQIIFCYISKTSNVLIICFLIILIIFIHIFNKKNISVKSTDVRIFYLKYY